jgi:outer membrane immunogenic protein
MRIDLRDVVNPLGARMKKLLLSIVFAIGGMAVATAADLPTAKPAPVFEAPAYNWTGFYLGGNLGGAWGSFDPSTSTVFSPIGYFATTSVPAINTVGGQSIKPAGFTGGAEGGYNWQTGNLVFGLEVDFGYLGLRGSASGRALYPCCVGTGFTVNSSAHTDWLLTARPRVGLAYNNLLFYATGGLAVTNLSSSFSFSDTFATAAASGSFSNTKTGYALGGGVEAGLWANWTVKAEYLYVNFGRVSTTSTNLTAFTPPIAFPTNVYTHSADLTASLVRLGVNYRF